MKTLPDFETWSPMWQRNGWNNCFLAAASALDYLSKYDRPSGGETPYNSIHCHDIAYDIRRSIEAMNRNK